MREGQRIFVYLEHVLEKGSKASWKRKYAASPHFMPAARSTTMTNRDTSHKGRWLQSGLQSQQEPQF
eukprot:1156797-Pelagomonas_calceolata.AAC.4